MSIFNARPTVVFRLNPECKRLLDRTEEVFLFDDDEVGLLLGMIFTKYPQRSSGLQSFGENMCSQISFYEMPNGKVVAVAYPSSVKVDYDEFKKVMRKTFSHVEHADFSGSMYGFMLYLERNGYERRKLAGGQPIS